MLEFTTNNIPEMNKIYDPTIVTKAAKSSLSKTKAKVETLISKITRERYNIKASSIKQAVVKSTSKGYVINYAGYRLSPKEYGATRVYVAKGTKRLGKRTTGRIYDTVSVKILKKNRKRNIKGKFRFGAFTARGKRGRGGPANKATTIFERMTKSRLKIKKVTSPAIPQIVGQSEVEARASKKTNEEMEKQFDTAMNFYLNKAAGLL